MVIKSYSVVALGLCWLGPEILTPGPGRSNSRPDSPIQTQKKFETIYGPGITIDYGYPKSRYEKNQSSRSFLRMPIIII